MSNRAPTKKALRACRKQGEGVKFVVTYTYNPAPDQSLRLERIAKLLLK